MRFLPIEHAGQPVPQERINRSNRITALAIAPGAIINDAPPRILTISNLDTVWVTANVSERFWGSWRTGSSRRPSLGVATPIGDRGD